MLFPAIALAGSWKIVGHTGEAAVHIDKESITREGAYLKVWTMWAYAEPRPLDDNPSKTYRSSKQLVFLDCAKRRMGTAEIGYYAGAVGTGEVVDRARLLRAAAAPFDVKPGTFGERMFDSACERPKSN